MPSETPDDLPESDDSQESDGSELCVRCLEPNDPSANFCVKCGAPISSYAATGPLERVFAQGDVYRNAADRPQKLIVVAGMWLLFAPLAAVGAFLSMPAPDGGYPWMLYRLLGVACVCVSVTILWKTTRNYLAGKKAGDDN